MSDNKDIYSTNANDNNENTHKTRILIRRNHKNSSNISNNYDTNYSSNNLHNDSTNKSINKNKVSNQQSNCS